MQLLFIYTEDEDGHDDEDSLHSVFDCPAAKIQLRVANNCDALTYLGFICYHVFTVTGL